MLVCPDCNHILTEETVPTDAPGGSVTVDQCPYCGGVWFDHYEINRFPTYHAIRLTSLARKGDFKNLKGFHKCPHCGVKLKILTEDSDSEYRHIMTCPHCRGHWVSKKELVMVKKYQDERLSLAKRLNIPLASPFSVLIPLLIFAFTVLAIPFTVNRIRQKQETLIRAKSLISIPIVIPIETGKVMISFNTIEPVTSSLKLTGPEHTNPVIYQIADKPMTTHTIHLTGLSSNSTYIYTITIRDKAGVKTESERFQFTTP